MLVNVTAMPEARSSVVWGGCGDGDGCHDGYMAPGAGAHSSSTYLLGEMQLKLTASLVLFTLFSGLYRSLRPGLHLTHAALVLATVVWPPFDIGRM